MYLHSTVLYILFYYVVISDDLVSWVKILFKINDSLFSVVHGISISYESGIYFFYFRFNLPWALNRQTSLATGYGSVYITFPEFPSMFCLPGAHLTSTGVVVLQ